jgi:LmbE family N-acetylglucosaminyl deacetylase
MPDTVLVIAPHPDDESIGCGGTISLHHQRGDTVHVVFLTSGELGLSDLPREEAWRVREREAQAAADVLGVSTLTFLRLPDWYLSEQVVEAAAQLQPIVESLAPGVIYTPHVREWHPDHQAAPAIVQQALRGGGGSLSLRAYEVWTPLAEYDYVEDITSVMSYKLRAVRSYVSQTPQFRYDRAIRGLNQYRGALAARCPYAEVFQTTEPSAEEQGAAPRRQP